jgi:4-amino-4-deoxy-L-arabinose transferase-like glycosyltransferase
MQLSGREPFRGHAVDRLALGSVLLVAFVLRVWHVTAGVPYAVGIDEPQVVDRALRILNTGDWNTHIFDYPSLVIYFHAWVAVACYVWGAVTGAWYSLGSFDIRAVYLWGRVAAAWIGVATVWLTYRLGMELGGTRVALVAAWLLAIQPSHVRESHFILTDVPATALTTATVLLAVRAARLRTIKAYGWAGATAGLAAAAKYNGAIAIVAVAAAWLIADGAVTDRWRKAGAALIGSIAGFMVGTPFALIDMPAFLDGFAAQLARFSIPRHGGDPAWLLYLKHLSLAGRYWVPAAVLGMIVVLGRRESRARWAPPVAFAFAYFYVLASHPLVFARYALPLSPVLCLFVAAIAVEVVEATRRWPALSGARASVAALAVLALVLSAGFIADVTAWLRQFGNADTRTIAADWLAQHSPPGTAVAVENSGPTYLNAAGFKVVGTELLLDHPSAWYAGRAQYLVISSQDLSRYADYIAAGTIVFEIAPAPTRWGPAILIVRL